MLSADVRNAGLPLLFLPERRLAKHIYHVVNTIPPTTFILLTLVTYTHTNFTILCDMLSRILTFYLHMTRSHMAGRFDAVHIRRIPSFFRLQRFSHPLRFPLSFPPPLCRCIATTLLW